MAARLKHYFNSYLVRLEVKTKRQLPLRWQNFNSYLVRLEVFEYEHHVHNQVHFNSYLVRLEERAAGIMAVLIFISIPTWCDQKYKQRARRKGVFDISIPTWCDQKSQSFLDTLITRKFQFLLGAIRSVVRLIFSLKYKDFNSYLVRLEEKETMFFNLQQLNFNSYLVRLEELQH